MRQKWWPVRQEGEEAEGCVARVPVSGDGDGQARPRGDGEDERDLGEHIS